MTRSILILGGGLTGLTAAHLFARQGDRVRLIEADDRIGGLAKTVESNGCLFDLGPHEFCTTNRQLVELLRSLLGDRLLLREKRACQFYRGKNLTYPFTPGDILRLGIPFTAQVCLETITARLKSLYWETHDYSFEKWVTRRFGRTLYRSYFGPYTRKVWGIDPDTLDARTASDRIAFNSIFDLALKTFDYYVLGRDDFSSIHSPLKHSFYYVEKGIGSLGLALAAEAIRYGAEIRTGSPARHVEIENDRAIAVTLEGGERIGDFDTLISTLPLPDLLGALRISLLPTGIRYRAMVFVFLAVPRASLTSHHWIYYPDPAIVFQRLSDFSHFNAGMTPEGVTGLCLEISCFMSDETWNLSDDEILRRCRRDLASVGVLSEEAAARARVMRLPHIYPLQVVGYIEKVREMLAELAHYPNIVSIGRQGLYKYCNMNECMEIAIDAVEQISSGNKPFLHRIEPRWRGAGFKQDHPAND